MTKRRAVFTSNISAPAPEQREHLITQHGQTRNDPYFWMRDENWQSVLRDPSHLANDIRTHLEAENAYYEAATQDLAALRETLFSEMRGRLKEDESSVPEPDGPFAYGVRFRKGGEYPVYYRTPRDGGSETILFDGEKEGEGETFFDIEDVAHSHDHSRLAIGIDRLGSEYFDIELRSVETGKALDAVIPSTDGNGVWAKDDQSLFYVERDDHQRPKRVKRHVLGTPATADEVIYEEPDDAFFLSIGETQSGEFLIISSSNGTSSEERFLRMDAPYGTAPTRIAPRMPDQLYMADHHGDYFYIQTNADNAVDFKIVRASINNPDRDHWEEWLAHEPGRMILSFVPYKNFMVRLERQNALPQLVVSDYENTRPFVLDFDEDAYALSHESGLEFDTDTIRFSYASPSTPTQIYDFDVVTRDKTLRKTQIVPSGHDISLYTVERLTLPSHDGAQIPVTILRLKTTPTDGTAPLLLYGYGSYGHTVEADFSTSTLSLVDRGVIYAIAHIRGSSACGRQWYLDGKLGKKTNSFHDFCAVADGLHKLGHGSPAATVIYGGSAGGLLVGASLNLRPDLFAGAIGAVPFVDVLTTISDGDLPLTPPEWVEWGDPIRDKDAFETIKDYSPYDNIKAGVHYPPVLATGGLTDYRVTYWEPAKWIARLRHEADGGPFFLKMNMDAGHGGSAARFERLKERAHDYAFALKILGKADEKPIHHTVDAPQAS